MTTRRSIIKGAVGASALAAPLTIPGLSALAQDGTPEAVEGPPPLPEGCELVASGLLSPRYIAIGEDGSVYVTEAGVGGDEEMFAPTEGTPEGTPEPQAPIATRGFSGQVTKVAPDGTVSVIASGLASYLIGGFEATGPAGIVLAGGLVWVAVGGPGPETPNVEPIEGQNSVVSIDEASGETTIVADLQTIEVEANPDGFGIDSNVYGMALGNDGLLYVADAGGNSISTVDPAAGGATLLAVTPGIEIPEDQAPPGGNPARAGANELDPVPCGVEAAADGGVHVSLLSGGPFPPGAAKVLTIGADGSVSDTVFGLTMATDVKIGPDGNVYVVQLSLNFLAEVPEAGNVVRVLADGSLEPVVEGLMLPNGIAFDPEGNLYIAAGTVTPPGAPPAGMLLKCAGVAPPA